MKKCILLGLLLSCFLGNSQNYYMATPQGFGAAATGGGNATPVTVTTYTAFRTALNSTTAANAVILVSGTIDCSYTSVTLNNKTIIGLPGARLRNTQITVGNSTTSANNSGIINIKPGSNNVIIRNLIFEGPGAYDVDGRDNLTADGCTNLWVDHCEFQDGIDGNFDNKGLTDNVTISWCKFTYLKAPIAGGSGGSADHRFSNLVGSAASDFPTDGRYSITFQNCYWAAGCRDRMPRVRNGQIHLVSCYYNSGLSSARAIGLGGGNQGTTCYVENTSFVNVSNVYTAYPADGGTVAINYSNCLNLGSAANIGTVPLPAYTTTPIPVGQVAAFLTDATCGAGATLQVTSAGVVSPSSCTLATTDFETEKILTFYPTVVEDTLKIAFSDKGFGKCGITIFSVTGQKVFELSKNINAGDLLELNLENLSKGTYIGKVEMNGKTENLRFIKN